MTNTIPKQLPGETDKMYEKRIAALAYLGDKWILAKKVLRRDRQ